MSVRIVRLGSPRLRGEGTRLGTVRHPPRGVPRQEHASRDFFDVWLPELAPSAPLLREARAGLDDARTWQRFARRYRAEMKAPAARHWLAVLAKLSHAADFSVGCYCENEARCHRSLLRELLTAHGARLA